MSPLVFAPAAEVSVSVGGGMPLRAGRCPELLLHSAGPSITGESLPREMGRLLGFDTGWERTLDDALDSDRDDGREVSSERGLD